jgi:hypothetical protein
MAIDTTNPRTRRAILMGALGGTVAAVAAAVGRASPVSATDGDAVLVGGTYSATGTTRINATGGHTALFGSSDVAAGVEGYSSAVGVYGDSDSGTGVYGSSSGTSQPAVLGRSLGNSTAVQGYSGSSAPVAQAKTGVHGYADQDSSAVGVHGQSPTGDGTVGESDAAGKSGLYAHNSNAGGWGVFGSNFGALTNGYIGGVNGVLGQARGSSGCGVMGYYGTVTPGAGPAKTGVYGSGGTGRGVVAKGDKAPLRLLPSTAANHPSKGALGDLFVDKHKRLWFCKGGTSWHQLA